MHQKSIKEKIKIVKEIVADEDEPYRTEAFRIILSKLLDSDVNEMHLTSKKKEKSAKKPRLTEKNWYRPESTVDKILKLKNKGFFNRNKTLSEIVDGLKSMDYHFESTDLTLPVRKIVRQGLLKKSKGLPDGAKSKQWTYVTS